MAAQRMSRAQRRWRPSLSRQIASASFEILACRLKSLIHILFMNKCNLQAGPIRLSAGNLPPNTNTPQFIWHLRPNTCKLIMRLPLQITCPGSTCTFPRTEQVLSQQSRTGAHNHWIPYCRSLLIEQNPMKQSLIATFINESKSDDSTCEQKWPVHAALIAPVTFFASVHNAKAIGAMKVIRLFVSPRLRQKGTENQEELTAAGKRSQ